MHRVLIDLHNQVQGQGGAAAKYSGVTDVLKHLYREGGLKSIFRGTGATLARDGPGSAAYVLPYTARGRFNFDAAKNNRYFAAYEITKKALTPAGASPSELNLSAIIIAGGTAGCRHVDAGHPPRCTPPRCYFGRYSELLTRRCALGRCSSRAFSLRQLEHTRACWTVHAKRSHRTASAHSGRDSGLPWHEYVSIYLVLFIHAANAFDDL